MPSPTRRPPVLDGTAILSDPTRCRILRLVDQHELTVSELCSVLQLPQSTVSRHLKTLAEGDWVAVRGEGTSNFYRMAGDGLPRWARELWQVVREEIAGDSAWRHDATRLESVLSDRVRRSQEFFASTAGEWDRLRDDLFGRRFDLLALPDLLDRDWTIGDLACGTGTLSAALAPCVEKVIAIDSSAAMLEAARARLANAGNVDVREGRLEHLPVRDGALDAAALMLGLAYVPEPREALEEAFRSLVPGGRLLVVDLLPHDREDLRRDMGQAWLGFGEDQFLELLDRTGFEDGRYRALPPDTKASGPSLFVASARKVSRSPRS